MTPSPSVTEAELERMGAIIFPGWHGFTERRRTLCKQRITAALSAPGQRWNFDMASAPQHDELLLYYAPVPKRNTDLPAMMRFGRIGDTPFRPPVAWMRVSPPAQE